MYHRQQSGKESEMVRYNTRKTVRKGPRMANYFQHSKSRTCDGQMQEDSRAESYLIQRNKAF